MLGLVVMDLTVVDLVVTLLSLVAYILTGLQKKFAKKVRHNLIGCYEPKAAIDTDKKWLESGFKPFEYG